MRVLVLAALLGVAGAVSVDGSAQVVTVAPSPSFSSGIGMVSGGVEGVEMSGMMGVQRGQPYLLVQKTSTVRVLADGTTITTEREERRYRDSEGRTRIETKQISPKMTFDMGMVMLFDPVAQTNTTLMGSSKEAHVMHFHAPKPPTPEEQAKLAEMRAKAEAARAARVAAGEKEQPKQSMESEALGTRNIAGMVVTGTRRVRTIPAGTVGNDRDIKVVMETWRSSELGMVLESTNDNPQSGKTTTEVVSFERTEPDPALFKVPEGYKVVEQKQNVGVVD